MKKSQNRFWKKGMMTLMICLPILSGCGITWWYGQVDYLLRIRIDQYFDLTAGQEDFITRQLESHLRWHRYEGIPVHIEFLAKARDGIADGVTEAEISWFMQQYREQLRMIIEQLSADSIQFLMQLEDQQIEYFAGQLQEDNEKYEERLKMGAAERLEVRADSTIDFLEDWLGSLTADQEDAVRRLSKALPDRFEDWYGRRRQRQQAFVALLRSHQGADELKAALLRMLMPDDRNSDPESRKQLFQMISAIDRMATPDQRRHVMEKLQGWVDSLEQISQKSRT